MKLKIALCGVLAAGCLIAGVRSLSAETVETWLIYDALPLLRWDGSTPPAPIGEGLRLERAAPVYGAE